MTTPASHGNTHIDSLLRYLFITLTLSYLITVPNVIGIAYASKVFYSIQLGVFNELNDAKDKVDSLKKLGHNAFYRHETRKGKGDVYRVCIERYGSQEEAEKEAEVLKDLDLISHYTIKAIEERPPAHSSKDKQYTKVYLLRIGSYKEQMNAEKVVNNLKRSGHNVFYRYEGVKGKGSYYRVYIAGYRSKSEALKDGKKLKKSGLIQGYAIRVMGEEPKAGVPLGKPGRKAYFLHISSFKERPNAEKTVKRLEKNGHRAFLVKEESVGESWFRVYIGEFNNEKAARKLGAELKEKGIISYFKPIEVNKDLFKK